MRKNSSLLTASFLALLVIVSGCSKDYKKEIIGKWIAVENNCDETGKCNSDKEVTGAISYMPDGRMIIDDDFKGKYTIKGDKIKFVLYKNELKLPGETEILYLEKNTLLSRTTFGVDMNEQSKETAVLPKQEPINVKYKREGK
jgi:hypothetical protein